MSSAPSSSPSLPSHARVVVIGGGVIGCSVAYHLAHAGVDVVLLERAKLTSGTTWHSAGLVCTFGSTSETSTEMRKYTRDLYGKLEAETGQATGFRACGFIEVAIDKDRLEEYRRVSAFQRHIGVDIQEISPSQVRDLFPIAKTDDILAGFYVAKDGRVDPVDVTMALAKGARQKGARIIEDCPVLGVTTKQGAVTGVQTAHGTITCETVVNCAGAWGRQLAAKNKINVPLQAAEHYYLITDHIQGVSRDWPVLEDPASHGYFREEGGGLMIGLFEPVCAPWKIEGVPEDFTFGEIQPDWDRMGGYIETAMRRVPITMETGVRKLFCGPESFTPDLLPCFGEVPEVKNYFVAAGLNSIGILTGGGIGKAMAHWIVNGSPDIDITAMNVDRLHRYQSNPEYRRTRTVESLGLVYLCHYPTRSMTTARGVKRAPYHQQLAERGAFFRDVSGWEGADWYAGRGVKAETTLTFGRANWWPIWQAEHKAVREGVVCMDMSFMSKFRVQGRDAGRCLNWISGGNVDGDSGRTTYTQWMNEHGKLEADLTVTKHDDGEFMVVSSDNTFRHTETWMRRQFSKLMPDGHWFITDITSGLAQLNVQGPKSRALLQAITSEDLANERFAFRDAREIDIGFARVLLQRITYLGELGYELYIPTEMAMHVYERLVEVGERFGLVHAGLKSLASCRMEKAYRDYGHDIDNTDDPLEAGLGFAADFKKPGGFLGKEALEAKKARGPLTRRLLQVLVKDPEPLMFHAEPVYRNGKDVGYIRAASYGHTLGGAVGLAMIDTARDTGSSVPLDAAWIAAGTWEVDIAGKKYPAVASLAPLYDPKSERVKM
jgi:4-methylaminobutanoate oxidase (formaldehyde-forming)